MRKDLLLFLFVLLFAILFSAAGHFLVGYLSAVIRFEDEVSCQSSKNDFKNSSWLPSYSANAKNSLPYWLPQL